jgi:lactate permease
MTTMINFLLALSPIAVVLVLMTGFRWGGAKAGAAGWLVTLGVSVFWFGADAMVLAYSQARAVLLTLYVLYIIWMALILYNVVNESGAISVIADGIVRLTGDPVLQLLILSWVFSAFLQGVAGFGVPIAVVAPLLIGLGFPPVTSVVAVAAGHSWSVSFGDIASSFNALIVASGLPGEVLAPWAAIMLGVACFGCGLAAAHAYRGFSTVKHGLVAIIIIGAVMALTQYVLAINYLWNLAGFVAGLAGLAAAAGVVRLPIYRGSRGREITGGINQKQNLSPGKQITEKPMSFMLSISPYLMLIVIVITAELFGPVHEALNQIKLSLSFPETRTAFDWTVAASMGKSISIFGHAGALLAYTSILAYVLFFLLGFLQSGAGRKIIGKTANSAVRSSIGIASMVGFAMMMDQSGMTFTLAEGLSQVLEPIFPFLSPFIGLLGAFMTGSNTNSNVVFTGLQQQTAALLGLAVPIILAAQTTGGSLGSMLAPAKIIVGCSTAGLAGNEGDVLRKTIVYGLIITTAIGIIAWIATSYIIG